MSNGGSQSQAEEDIKDLDKSLTVANDIKEKETQMLGALPSGSKPEDYQREVYIDTDATLLICRTTNDDTGRINALADVVTGFVAQLGANLQARRLSMHDYAAVREEVEGFPSFAHMETRDLSIEISQTTVSPNLKIISGVFGGLLAASVGASEVVNVLKGQMAGIMASAGGATSSVSTAKASYSICHAMVIIENVGGIIWPKLKIYSIDQEVHQYFTRNPCGRVSHTYKEIKIKEDVYTYLDQAVIDFVETSIVGQNELMYYLTIYVDAKRRALISVGGQEAKEQLENQRQGLITRLNQFGLNEDDLDTIEKQLTLNWNRQAKAQLDLFFKQKGMVFDQLTRTAEDASVYESDPGPPRVTLTTEDYKYLRDKFVLAYSIYNDPDAAATPEQLALFEKYYYTIQTILYSARSLMSIPGRPQAPTVVETSDEYWATTDDPTGAFSTAVTAETTFLDAVTEDQIDSLLDAGLTRAEQEAKRTSFNA